MRDKQVILESEHINAIKAKGPEDIALVHSLLTLEVLIDIRDALITDVKDALNALIEIRKTHLP